MLTWGQMRPLPPLKSVAAPFSPILFSTGFGPHWCWINIWWVGRLAPLFVQSFPILHFNGLYKPEHPSKTKRKTGKLPRLQNRPLGHSHSPGTSNPPRQANAVEISATREPCVTRRITGCKPTGKLWFLKPTKPFSGHWSFHGWKKSILQEKDDQEKG